MLMVTTLNSDRIDLSTLTSAQLLDATAGSYIDLPNPSQDGSALHLSMPASDAPFDALAYVVKLTFAGRIPELS
jgi:alpha-L-fucosidase